MRVERIARIREAEKQYHDRLFEEHRLFEPGTWMSKPIGTIMELLDDLPALDSLQVLDLGCGPGRHCIPIAQRMGARGLVTGVDLLDSAIMKLETNCREYGVAKKVRGIRCDIEQYPIEAARYDYIIAVSSLEHLSSEEALKRKLAEMAAGTKPGGINVVLFNTSIAETVIGTGEQLVPMFELNLAEERLQELLGAAYAGWQALAASSKSQVFEIERDGRLVELASVCVTLAVRKPYATE